eukprot:7281359-Karenia_brevis.AAC.1
MPGAVQFAKPGKHCKNWQKESIPMERDVQLLRAIQTRVECQVLFNVQSLETIETFWQKESIPVQRDVHLLRAKTVLQDVQAGTILA